MASSRLPELTPMQMQDDRTRGRAALALALFVLIGAVGLVALPVTLGGDATQAATGPGSARLSDMVWLIGAVIASISLVVLAPTLSRTLSGALAKRWPEAQGRVDAGGLGRFIVAAISIVLIQTMVRAPFVRVIGAGSRPDAYLVEACFAAVAFLALLAAVSSIYRAAYPGLEALISAGLDATVATTTSEAATRATQTIAPTVAETLAAPAILRSRAAETLTDPSRTQ